MEKILKFKEDFELELNTELLLVKEFELIVTRAGKRKIQAFKEIGYVYHMANPSSPYYNYSETDRHLKLKSDLFNEINPAWEPDDVVKAAIVKYRELTKTPSLHAVDSMLNSLHECNDIIIEITKQLKQDLLDGKHKSGINNKRGQIVSGTELMLNDLTALLKVSKEIPNHIDVLEKLQKKLQEERKQGKGKIKGNVNISERER